MRLNTHLHSKTSRTYELSSLLTPKGGTVLDPFMGSGSTALQKMKVSIL